MGDKSAIEWTDATWNPIRARNLKTGKIGWHCEHATTGCEFCYAERFNERLGTGLPFKPGHRKDIEIFLDEKMLTQPLRWKKPRRIFPFSMTDLFADFVPDAWIDRVFAVMALCPQHMFQVLTKRAARMRNYFAARTSGDPWAEAADDIADLLEMEEHPRVLEPKDMPLPNVWLGVSCEDQARADDRIPDLLATPAAVRFVSAEPLLGPIDFRRWMNDWGCESCGYGGAETIDHCPNCGWVGRASDNDVPCPECNELLSDYYACPECEATNEQGFGVTLSGHTMGYLKWIIAGGESGPGARPMHPDWVRGIRDQCAAAGTAFFFKQWGEWAVTKPEAGGDLGGDMRRDQVRFVQRDREADGHFRKGDVIVRRSGKKKAGRLLDGIEHNGYPG